MRGIAAGPEWQCRSTAPTSSAATSASRLSVLAGMDVTSAGFVALVTRPRVVVGVEHPALLLGEIDARRAEDVDELIVARVDRARGVDRRRRDHGDRRRRAVLVVVIAPLHHVRDPRPADVVNEGAVERERALLEIV